VEKAEAFPFRLALGKVRETPPMISEGLSLFLVLSGNLEIQTAENSYPLCADDLFVINPLQQYQLKSNEKNLFLTLQISREPIIPELKGQSLPYIICTDKQQDAAKFQQLREALIHLMVAYFKPNQENEFEIYQHLFTVLSRLVKSFQQTFLPLPPMTVDVAEDWLNELLQYIQQHYDSPISLEELAKQSGLSYSHLSRVIKKQLGVTFTDYLNQIRLIHATEELLLTKQPIIKIAMDNGFSNTKHFHQVFKRQYGVTPANYRKQYSLTQTIRHSSATKTDYQEIVGQAALQELAKYLAEKDIVDENAATQQQLELLMPPEIKTTYHHSKKIIKIGPASEGLAGGVQRELTILQRDLAFDLVQFEGFCEETNFEKNVLLISEYILNNQWFDFLVNIQLKPMIELNLPSEYETREAAQLWCDKQLKIIRHFLNRYGMQEVSGWYFQWSRPKEIQQWNTASRWAYHYFYRKLKQLVPLCRMGMLSLRTLSEAEYVDYGSFVEEQMKQNCLPDFISFHADPYAFDPDNNEEALHFKEFQQDVLTRVKSVVANIQTKRAPLWQPELFLTDWNTLVGKGNTFSGTFFRSALILESILELTTQVEGMAFWLNIKVKERLTHVREDSSLSVFLYEELRRPLFFSLRFLNHLNGELVARGEGYILTRNQEHLQLLLYNSSYLDPQYSVDSFRVKYQTKKMEIHLKGLAEGEYLIREYVLDKDHGGIYNDWMKVGGQVEIDYELQKYLEQKILPKFELSKTHISNTGYVVESTLTLNACKLYLFQRIY
jgi:beta-xylosidase/AraC-like DNA-binding protein